MIFGAVWGLVWLRKRVTERVLGMNGKFSARDDPGTEEEDEETFEMQEVVVEK